MRKLRFLLVSSAVGDFGRPQRPAWLALAVVAGGLTVGASMTLLRFFVIRLRLPCIVALPVVSIVGEALRDHIGWDLAGIIGEVVSLAITQSDQRIVRQIAELGGASAIAWIVAVVNGFLVDWMRRPRREERRPQTRECLTGICLSPVAAGLMYRFQRDTAENR